jgi:hypothetical protein
MANETDGAPLNAQTFIRATAERLWDNLPLVLAGGLLFCVASAPSFVLWVLGLTGPALLVGVVTVGPAWAALLKLEAELLLGRPASLLTMLRALAAYWAAGARLGALATVPFFAALWTLPALALAEVPLLVWFGIAADGVGALVLFVLYLYTFPLLVLYEVGVLVALRNSILLASRAIAHTMGMLAIAVLLTLAVRAVGPALLFVLPAFYGMFVVNGCRLALAEQGVQI